MGEDCTAGLPILPIDKNVQWCKDSSLSGADTGPATAKVFFEGQTLTYSWVRVFSRVYFPTSSAQINPYANEIKLDGLS